MQVGGGRADATRKRKARPVGLIKRVIRQKVKTPAKRKIRQQARRASVKCGTCGKRYANPLTHTCVVETDFAKRKRAAERQAKAEAARLRKQEAADRRRAAAAARRAKAASSRAAPARRPAHDYRTCRDNDCARHACAAYKAGYEDGITDSVPGRV